MFKRREKYIKPACALNHLDLESTILAESVNNNSMVSSVGQEIGVDVTFEADEFVNTSWETGTN